MTTASLRSLRTLNRATSAFEIRLRAVAAKQNLGPCSRVRASRSCFSTSASTPAPLSQLLRVSEEVADAIATNKPVVALESTIYTHGALGNDLLLEDVVRKNGAVPAVCGILAGIPTVGLTPDEIERMVSEGAKKASRRDFAYVVGMGTAGKKMHGGTTIAGTMILARLAGIRVFGTGGLGGVHRGGQDSMDISADLTELGRTRVAVVSSGCKGFLDIPRTLEFLETQGVLVSTFADGRQGNVDFPAFWARDSGSPSPAVVQDEKQAAAMILAQEQLDIESGLLFANPIPSEFAISREDMDAAIGTAVREAEEKGFHGNANTPWVLQRIRELTHGRSVPANKALVRANVARAAGIAVELSKLLADLPARKLNESKANISPLPGMQSPDNHRVDILVAGSVALDLSCDYTQDLSAGRNVAPSLHTSNPSIMTQTVGGVGHNVALAAHKVSGEGKVRLCSMIGDDIAGSTVLLALESSGLDTSCIRQLGNEYHSARTAQYVAVNDAEKNLMIAMADMAILTSHSFPHYWRSAIASSKPKWLVVDGNWNTGDIRSWIQAGREHGAKIAFEPVSTAKSKRLFPPLRDEDAGWGLFPHNSIDLATPNQYELEAMHEACSQNGYLDGLGSPLGEMHDLSISEIASLGVSSSQVAQIASLLPFIPTLITKLGAKGLLHATLLEPGDRRLHDPAEEKFIIRTRSSSRYGGIYLRHHAAAETVQDIVSVNGVGDTFLGVLVAGLAQGGMVDTGLLTVAQRAAVLTLKSHHSVSEELGVLQSAVRAAAQGK
ncbi:hypothetical protein GQ53DRAFT_661827 [Thozetella sp. PMI_491]|nr:hypothetical protein GQ53DRAFT_661827 [Thozetella sp. PMI_491]